VRSKDRNADVTSSSADVQSGSAPSNVRIRMQTLLEKRHGLSLVSRASLVILIPITDHSAAKISKSLRWTAVVISRYVSATIQDVSGVTPE